MMKKISLYSLKLHPAWIPALFSAAAWGILPVSTRMAMHQNSQANPIMIMSFFLTLRFGFSAIMIHFYGKMKEPETNSLQTLKKIFQSSPGIRNTFWIWSIILLLNFWVQIYAMSKIPAGLYSLLFSMNPLIGVAIATRKEKGNFFLTNLFPLSLIISGSILFCMNESFSGGSPHLWAWICFVSGIGTWLTFSFLSEKMMKSGISPLQVSALSQWISILSGLVLLAKPFQAYQLITENLYLIPYAGLTGTLGVFAVYGYQLAISRSTKIAFLSQYFEPVITFIAAGFLLGEETNLIQWFAAVLSLYGLYFLMKNSENQPTPTET